MATRLLYKRGLMQSKYLVIFFLLLSGTALAHPVIYKDGIVASSMTMGDMTDANVSYSFHPRWSAGVNYWRLTDGVNESEWQLAKLNHLVYRYNGEESQGNLYLHAGLGRTESATEKDRLGYMTGLEADWETRKLYLSGKYLHLGSAQEDTGIWVGRIGVSPIMADFKSLQSWAMVQVWYDPITAREAKVTPLLRFFYHNVLWEMGASLKGDMMLNLMIHL